MSTAKLSLDGKEFEFPVTVGSEGEVGIDIAKLRGATKAITLDPGYGNTGSCQSAITFIDGEKGVLRYRGYPIDQLVNKLSFEETIALLIHGELPNASQLDALKSQLAEHAELPQSVLALVASFPKDAHPMGILQAATVALSGAAGDPSAQQDVDTHAIRMIAQYKALAAAIYRHGQGLKPVASKAGLSYAADFYHMMFDKDEVDADIEAVLDNLLILHADHEQNCSTSTVRMVASAHANLYASVSAGVGALWGPLHGGANQSVLEMLSEINESGVSNEEFIAKVKDKSSDTRLMGFGHRVYKNHDPRATLIKASCDKVLAKLGVEDPLLNIAKSLEQTALNDEYFTSRKLFPNVDFYSGIIYRALDIPVNLFTVLFALGRLPGWISQWKELHTDGSRINRPRQIYIGETVRDVPAIGDRG